MNKSAIPIYRPLNQGDQNSLIFQSHFIAMFQGCESISLIINVKP